MNNHSTETIMQVHDCIIHCFLPLSARPNWTTVNSRNSMTNKKTARQNLTDLLEKNMNKKFNVTHEYQLFIAKEISFIMVRWLSTDVLKSKVLLPLFKAAKNAFPDKKP